MFKAHLTSVKKFGDVLGMGVSIAMVVATKNPATATTIDTNIIVTCAIWINMYFNLAYTALRIKVALSYINIILLILIFYNYNYNKYNKEKQFL